MSGTPKKKPSRWRNFLKGAGSVLVLDPFAGPPPVTRQQLAAQRTARMKDSGKGRKYVVTLLHPAGAVVSGARKVTMQVAEGTARLIETDGGLPRKLTQLMVFGRSSDDLGADVPTAVEDVR